MEVILAFKLTNNFRIDENSSDLFVVLASICLCVRLRVSECMRSNMGADLIAFIQSNAFN